MHLGRFILRSQIASSLPYSSKLVPLPFPILGPAKVFRPPLDQSKSHHVHIYSRYKLQDLFPSTNKMKYFISEHYITDGDFFEGIERNVEPLSGRGATLIKSGSRRL